MLYIYVLLFILYSFGLIVLHRLIQILVNTEKLNVTQLQPVWLLLDILLPKVILCNFYDYCLYTSILGQNLVY